MFKKILIGFVFFIAFFFILYFSKYTYVDSQTIEPIRFVTKFDNRSSNYIKLIFDNDLQFGSDYAEIYKCKEYNNSRKEAYKIANFLELLLA